MKIKPQNSPQPQSNPSMLESHRRLVERAIQDAERPSGMTTHDGKARIDASVLRRMLAIIDTQPQPERQPVSEELAHEIWSSAQLAPGEGIEDGVERIAALIEGAVSEPRPCTCHPDDNPPVPCAQQYALSECRPEPTEAQLDAVAAVLFDLYCAEGPRAWAAADTILRAALLEELDTWRNESMKQVC